ncbi:hypothetical protein ES708_16288 [subsurface metagenome]
MTVPCLFKGLGIANKKVAISIAINIIIKIFLFSLRKEIPRDDRKIRNIKIEEIPKAR